METNGGKELQTAHLWRERIQIFAGVFGIVATITSGGAYMLWYATVQPISQKLELLSRDDDKLRTSLAEESHAREASIAVLRAEREARTAEVQRDFREALKAHNDQPGHPVAVARIEGLDHDVASLRASILVEHAERRDEIVRTREAIEFAVSHICPQAPPPYHLEHNP